MAKTSSVATRHTTRPAAPPRTRLGSLVWWRFQGSAADLATLAIEARKAKFPAIYLPLPHPISPSAAFNRMVRAGERRLGVDRWQSDRVARDEVHGREEGREVPAPVLEWIEGREEELLIAVSETFEPEHAPLEPWRVWLWICLRDFDGARYLPTMEVVKFFMVVLTGAPKPSALDITDHVVAVGSLGDPGKAESALRREAAALGKRVGRVKKVLSGVPARAASTLAIAVHQFRVLDRERTLATSPEIGDGVNLALESVGGVKLRPGLYVVPSEAGVQRAEATEKYVSEVPNAEAGLMDIYGTSRTLSLAALVQPILADEIRELARDVDAIDPDEAGIATIQALWRRIAAEQDRLERAKSVLGGGFTGLRGELAKLARELRRKARQVEARTGHKLVLTRRPTPDCARLQRRLRKLEEAARDAALSQAHGGKAKERAKVLAAAVEEAGDFVAATCR